MPGPPSSRREFLLQAAVATVVSGCAGSWPGRPAEIDVDRDRPIDPTRLPPIPAAITYSVERLFAWAAENGWFERMQWPLVPPTSAQDPNLFAPFVLRADGFDDFAGHSLIHPGRPELSALYHALASPGVKLADGASVTQYPTLEYLDALENFIYALSEPELEDGSEYRLAVLAYEYRRKAMTPHRKYADLVFSRTGISRVGSEPLHYDRIRREFSTLAEGGDPRRIAVTGARFGVFLVRIAGLERATVMGMPYITTGDPARRFVSPIRKIFSGDRLLSHRDLAFETEHRNEQLARLAAI